MRYTTQITIEHVEVSSERSYEGVKASLDARMSTLGNTDEFARQVAAAHASWEQVTQAIEKRLGASGFSIFSKIRARTTALAGGKTQAGKPICHWQSTSRDQDD